MKYARNIDGCWIDVYEVPNDVFTDLADLERKLGVEGFVAVDDAVKHGDFVDGDSGFTPRPEITPTIKAHNADAHKSIVRIRAKNLAKQGKNFEAIMLLKTIGE